MPPLRALLRPARGARVVALAVGPVRAAFVLGLLLLALAAPAPLGAAASAPSVSDEGMVASPQPDATRAGVEVLRDGGNAVDAAVATAVALCVTDAHHSGLGGGGFLLIRTADGDAVAIDARETAPAAATRDMYVKSGVPEDASKRGALAVATPGLLRGLVMALAEHGTMTLERVMRPAIRLAEEGFAVGPRHVRTVRYWAREGGAERFPGTAAIQLPEDREAFRPGWTLVQEELAETLRRIAEEGPEVFYEGALGRAIVEEVQERGGILRMDDLRGYRAKVREPVRGVYRSHTVLSFPPPSSGGIALVQMLNVLEGFDLGALDAGSSHAVHLATEAMKLAFADRAAHLGDGDFVDVPRERLTSESYADALRARINPPRWRRAPWTWHRDEVAIEVKGPGFSPSPGGTTHLSVTDAEGGAVAITQTVNLLFGSGITVPGTGVVLNDEMDDFAKAIGEPNAFGLVATTGANAIAPGKRPLSSMSPTILVRSGRPYLVTGSPGGPRIITTTLESILNVVDWEMDVQEALAFRRFHHQWVPRRLSVEPPFSSDVIEALRARGHTVEVSEREWSNAQAVRVDPDTGRHYGASDPRGDGLALGP